VQYPRSPGTHLVSGLLPLPLAGASGVGVWCVRTRTRSWLVPVHQGKTAELYSAPPAVTYLIAVVSCAALPVRHRAPLTATAVATGGGLLARRWASC